MGRGDVGEEEAADGTPQLDRVVARAAEQRRNEMRRGEAKSQSVFISIFVQLPG